MSASLLTFANLGRKQNLKTADILPVIRSLEEAAELKQVICQINTGFHFARTSSAVPRAVHVAMRVYEKISGTSFSRTTRERLFDWFAQHRLASADVTLFHGGFFLPKTAARARTLGSILVDITVTAHFLTNAALEKEEGELLGITYEGWYSRWVPDIGHLKSFDYIIAISDFVRDSYLRAGFPADRIYQAHLDIDTQRFTPPATPRKEDATFKVLYLADTQPLKGLHYLLAAWKELQLPNAQLLVVGKFGAMPESLTKKYLDLIESDSSIQRIPHTHEPEAFYRDASVFVLPSLTEGFSRSAIEAMACGLPVITTENARGMVEDGKTGYVVPIRDVQALKDKLEYLYRHREVAAQMGRAARQAVEEKKPFGQAVLEIYRDILRRESTKKR